MRPESPVPRRSSRHKSSTRGSRRRPLASPASPSCTYNGTNRLAPAPSKHVHVICRTSPCGSCRWAARACRRAGPRAIARWRERRRSSSARPSPNFRPLLTQGLKAAATLAETTPPPYPQPRQPESPKPRTRQPVPPTFRNRWQGRRCLTLAGSGVELWGFSGHAPRAPLSDPSIRTDHPRGASLQSGSPPPHRSAEPRFGPRSPSFGSRPRREDSVVAVAAAAAARAHLSAPPTGEEEAGPALAGEHIPQ